MDALDQYLTGPFQSDKQVITELERVIIDTSETLINAFDKTKGMPYTLKRGEEPSFGKHAISQSTTAMVTLAIWRLLGRCIGPIGRSAPKSSTLNFANEDKIIGVAKDATDLLISSVIHDGALETFSSTYGYNDPITLAFLAEISNVDFRSRVNASTIVDEKKITEIKDKLKEHIEKLTGGDGFCDNQLQFYRFDADYSPRIMTNALVPLRIVQANRALAPEQDIENPDFRAYFEKTLHGQLSFSSIPDSRFDPAELAFCLEGLLLVQRNAVDPTLFKRVIDVLEEAQQESAFWRPTKPFLAQDNGMSLFPISVEVANSILRSCELYDTKKIYEAFGSINIGLFSRYWQWLRAREVRFKAPAGHITIGWHSENVNEVGAIHVWETSQVIEFLISYRNLLHEHIARKTLALSRFSIRAPRRAKKWEEVVGDFEPVTVLGNGYQFYSRIGVEFLKGWREKSPKYFSMLLFGPPGTGKTTVAENIADDLRFPMITITVSDFLASGGAQLESRAKAIFDVLGAQSNCIVLFDEIDNFILDRDAARYANQDTAFQFMTPGMLTKLNDLRKAKSLIFVVATNYENRIDSAIKRTGRIDKRYLVLPPDAKARQRMIRLFLGREKLDPDSIQDWDAVGRCRIALNLETRRYGSVPQHLIRDRMREFVSN